MSPCSHNREALVAALRERGVRYLAPSDARAGERPIPPEELIACLARNEDTRLRLALVPLFILNPHWADLLPAIELPSESQAVLRKHYTAAACLQRMWSIRLGFYLNEVTLLPDLFSEQLGLPSIDIMDGKLCLHALAEGDPFDQLSAYDGVMDLLFAQLKAEAHRERAAAR